MVKLLGWRYTFNVHEHFHFDITVPCHWTSGLFSGFCVCFVILRRAVLILYMFLVVDRHYYYNLGILHHKVTWLTSTFTSRITMLSCFMFQAEDRASFMTLTLPCHSPAPLTPMWKMPLSLTRTSIHSSEGEEIQGGFTYFSEVRLWRLYSYFLCMFVSALVL